MMKKLTLILATILTVALLCSCAAQGGRITSQGGGTAEVQASASAEATSAETASSEAPAPSATETLEPESSEEPSPEPTEAPITGSTFTHKGYEWTYEVIPDAQTADFVDLDNRSELEVSAHPQPDGTKPLVIEFLACSKDGQPVDDMDAAYTDIGIMGLVFVVEGGEYSTPVTHTITNTGVDGTTKQFYIYVFVPEDTADQPDITVKSV